MSTKARYFIHQRDAIADCFADLGTREMGYGSNENYLAFTDEQENDRYIPTFSINSLRESNGNLGLDVAPLATGALFSSFTLGGNAFLMGNTAAGANNGLWLSQNAHYDTDNSWEYISTDEASLHFMGDGGHILRTVASGDAGDNITWIDAITIAADGVTTFGNDVFWGDNKKVLFGNSTSDSDGIIQWNTGFTPDALQIRIDNAGDLRIQTSSGHIIMSPTTGNVGIGVTDPDTTLEIFNAGDQLKLSFDGTDNCVFAVDTAGKITLTPSGGECFISANTGIDITPWPTHADFSSLSIGGNGYILAHTATAAGKGLYIAQNAQYDTDGSWEYISEDEASIYDSTAGGHTFRVASLGAAGANISWTTAITITNDAKVGIGDGSPAAKLEVLDTSTQLQLSYDGTDNCTFTVDTDGELTVTPSGGITNINHATLNSTLNVVTARADGIATLNLTNDATTWSFRCNSTDNFQLVNGVANPVSVESGASTNSLYITSGGNVAIGASSAAGKLEVFQESASGAIPVLWLDQADDDEPFIAFEGDAASADKTKCLVDSGDGGDLAVFGFVKVEIKDDGNQIADGDYYMQFGTLPGPD